MNNEQKLQILSEENKELKLALRKRDEQLDKSLDVVENIVKSNNKKNLIVSIVGILVVAILIGITVISYYFCPYDYAQNNSNNTITTNGETEGNININGGNN